MLSGRVPTARARRRRQLQGYLAHKKNGHHPRTPLETLGIELL